MVGTLSGIPWKGHPMKANTKEESARARDETMPTTKTAETVTIRHNRSRVQHYAADSDNPLRVQHYAAQRSR